MSGDLIQDCERVGVQARRVDFFADRQVAGELPQSFAQLPFGAGQIAPLQVVQSYGHVDQGLQKQAPRSALGRPFRFEHFVALEEFAAIEEVDSPLDEFGHASPNCRTAAPAPRRFASFISEYLRDNSTPSAPARRAARTASRVPSGVDLL